MRHEPEDSAGKAALVTAIRDFCGDALRDVWLFDEADHEALFVREDVADKLESVEVDGYIDNERYGFVTRATYKELYYADYEYTVRGFDRFEKFRTFPAADAERKIGLLLSVDRRSSGYNYGDLYEHLLDVVDAHPIADFVPASARER